MKKVELTHQEVILITSILGKHLTFLVQVGADDDRIEEVYSLIRKFGQAELGVEKFNELGKDAQIKTAPRRRS